MYSASVNTRPRATTSSVTPPPAISHTFASRCRFGRIHDSATAVAATTARDATPCAAGMRHMDTCTTTNNACFQSRMMPQYKPLVRKSL